jgi:trk system potassium uptake protein
MTLLVNDAETAVSSVVASVSNVGPGFGAVGPLAHYGWMPPAAKSILIICMLLGRLEFMAILAFLLPSFWRR